MKKLYKSSTDKVFSGVIGGIGEYYNTDPTILRLGYIFVAIVTALFPAVIGYIIASMVVPSRPAANTDTHTTTNTTPPNNTTV